MPTDATAGAPEVVSAPVLRTLAEEVTEVAGHLEHAAQLALIAARGEEPERGAAYIVETLRELGPRLAALMARVAVLAAIVPLLP